MGSIDWLTKYPIARGYIPQYIPSQIATPHYAVDILTPFHTVLTSLVDGTVKSTDYPVFSGQANGGRVIIKNDRGGPDLQYNHFDLIEVRPGQRVKIGDRLGLSGGQLSGGYHPVGPMWSSGPHVHIQWFSKYINSPVGLVPYGPDIMPYLNQLKNGIPVSPGGSPTAPVVSNPLATVQTLSAQVHQTLIETPGFYGIALAIDEAEQFPGYTDLSKSQFDVTGIIRSVGASTSDNFIPFLIRSGVFLLGFILLIVLVAKVAAPIVEKAAPAIAAAA